MKKILLAVAVYILTYCTGWSDDSRLIRRLYLDTVKMPPTIEEIEWYISYNKTKGYEMAVDWVLTKYGEEKLKSYYLKDLAKAVCDSCKINIIGSRPGEKTHEEMISFYDSRTTMDLKDFFVILPEGLLNKYLFKKYLDLGYKLVNEGFVYRSDINKEFVSLSELKNIIKEFIKK